jgi:hypothetical protein
MICASAVRIVVAIAAALLIAGAGAAQNVSLTTTSQIGGGGGAAPIAERHVDRYAEVLGLTADQRDVADDLFATFTREYTAARVEHDEQMGDLRAEAQESGDFELFVTEMPRVSRRFNQEVDRLRDRFFDDLRLLLTADQDARWGDLERTRRRVETIGEGTLSGESVDLVSLIDDLEPPAAIRADLAPTLDRYEADLDRALQKRNELREERSEGMEPGRLDIEAMEETMRDVREASAEVRDVNQRYARRVSGMLPTELAERFDRMVRRASFPTVYRETYTSRVLGTALEFDDLESDQRNELERLMDEYRRRLDDANDRWAEAIAANEENQRSAILTGPGGEPVTLMIGEESEELEDVRKARRDLNRDMLSRVRGLLSPEQRSRLPEREVERRVNPGGGARMMFIEMSAEDDDGDGEPDTEDVDIRPR